MFQYNLLRDEDIEPLGEGVLKVLERVGILCQNQEMLQALDKSGAKVDYAHETATFPRQMVAELLTQIRKESQDTGAGANRRFGKPALPHMNTQVAQFLYDYEKGQRRSGNSEDFAEVIKLGDVLHPEIPVGHSLLLTDVPPMMEPLEAAMLLAEYARNPAGVFTWNARQVDYLTEMGDIYGIDNWFNWGATCIAHPFRFDKDLADRFVLSVKFGHVAGLTAMPVAGITTPISAAGFIAVGAAEIFATWLAGRALNPDVPLGGNIWGGSADMKTCEVSYSSFDAMFYTLSLSEFLRKWTGKNVPVGGGEYCDAKEPGYYAALEKAYKAMVIAAFSGSHPCIGQGMLENGKTLCPVQLVLERELATGVQFLGRTVEVSAETLSLETIFEVGFGQDDSYLFSEGTTHHFREHLWCPELMDRSGWKGSETDELVLGKIQKKVNELMASYEKPEVDPGKLAKMREVVERARKDLLA